MFAKIDTLWIHGGKIIGREHHRELLCEHRSWVGWLAVSNAGDPQASRSPNAENTLQGSVACRECADTELVSEADRTSEKPRTANGLAATGGAIYA